MVMARGVGKTIREAEQNCFERALIAVQVSPNRRIFKRGERSRRVIPTSAWKRVEELELAKTSR